MFDVVTLFACAFGMAVYARLSWILAVVCALVAVIPQLLLNQNLKGLADAWALLVVTGTLLIIAYSKRVAPGGTDARTQRRSIVGVLIFICAFMTLALSKIAESPPSDVRIP